MILEWLNHHAATIGLEGTLYAGHLPDVKGQIVARKAESCLCELHNLATHEAR